MPSNLRATIADLAASFATNVLAALRGASLEDILSETAHIAGTRGGAVRGRSSAPPSFGASAATRRGGKGGRLERRSADDIAGLVDRIADLLVSHPDGMRAEQIREALNLEAKELPRPLADGLAAKKIVKQGQKRATTYFAKGALKAGVAPKRAAKKAAKKKAD